MQPDDVRKYFVPRPGYEIDLGAGRTGRMPVMTFLSNDLVPGAGNYVEASWIVAMPTPNPDVAEHTHDFDEIVMHLGSNPDDEEDLGAEIEFVLDGVPLIITKTSTIFVPKGMKHGPLTWKRFTRPHIEMTIMLGAGTLAAANPGGDQSTQAKKP